MYVYLNTSTVGIFNFLLMKFRNRAIALRYNKKVWKFIFFKYISAVYFFIFSFQETFSIKSQYSIDGFRINLRDYTSKTCCFTRKNIQHEHLSLIYTEFVVVKLSLESKAEYFTFYWYIMLLILSLFWNEKWRVLWIQVPKLISRETHCFDLFHEPHISEYKQFIFYIAYPLSNNWQMQFNYIYLHKMKIQFMSDNNINIFWKSSWTSPVFAIENTIKSKKL